MVSIRYPVIMTGHQLPDYIERWAHFVRHERRLTAQKEGLQPVHMDVLLYLARCNKFSNRPLAVADYLQLTKGTVSQSIKLLEKKGFIERTLNFSDKRQVHLFLTHRGREIVKSLDNTDQYQPLLAALNDRDQAHLKNIFDHTLKHHIQNSNLTSFGLCRTCKHHRIHDNDERFCALVREKLFPEEINQICREHDY